MPKLDAFSLPRPVRPQETRSFHEPGLDEALTLTLRAPDTMDRLRASQVAEELWVTFVTGETHGSPAPFPIEGEFTPSKPLFYGAAILHEMQCPANPGDRYSVIELVLLSIKLPRAWAQVQEFVGELMLAWETELPK